MHGAAVVAVVAVPDKAKDSSEWIGLSENQTATLVYNSLNHIY